MKKDRNPTSRNFVAKYAHRTNKSVTMVDRKKQTKNGYRKHKRGLYNGS